MTIIVCYRCGAIPSPAAMDIANGPVNWLLDHYEVTHPRVFQRGMERLVRDVYDGGLEEAV